MRNSLLSESMHTRWSSVRLTRTHKHAIAHKPDYIIPETVINIRSLTILTYALAGAQHSSMTGLLLGRFLVQTTVGLVGETLAHDRPVLLARAARHRALHTSQTSLTVSIILGTVHYNNYTTAA